MKGKSAGKRMLSLLLAFIMVLGIMPQIALPARAEYEGFTCKIEVYKSYGGPPIAVLTTSGNETKTYTYEDWIVYYSAMQKPSVYYNGKYVPNCFTTLHEWASGGVEGYYDGYLQLRYPEPDYYYLYFNANGGTGGPSRAQSTTSGSFTIPTETPTWAGREFLGWGTSATSTTPSYQPGQSISIASGSTLYAVWRRTGYAITFKPNGGGGTMAQQEVPLNGSAVGTPKTANLNRNTFTAPSYPANLRFAGWSRTQYPVDTGIPEFKDGAPITLTDDEELYAVWRAANIITFHSNDGTNRTATQSVPFDETESLDSPFTRLGWRLDGWAESADGPVKYTPGQAVKPTGDMELYAKWTRTHYVITFDANGGGGTMEPQLVSLNGAADGTRVTATLNRNESTPPATPPELRFVGWSTPDRHAPGTGVADYRDGKEIELTGDVTLHAVWRKYFIISFYPNGGSGNMADLEVIPTDPVTLPENKFTRARHRFDHWNTQPDDNGTRYEDRETFVPTSDLDLHAQWVELYDIYFNFNGGTDGPADMLQCEPGAQTLPTTKPVRTAVYSAMLDKYVPVVFMGWTENVHIIPVDRDDPVPAPCYKAGDSYTLTDNVMLHALWAFDANNNNIPDVEETRIELIYHADTADGLGTGAPAKVENLLRGEPIDLSRQEPTHASVNGTAVKFIGWAENAADANKIYLPTDALPYVFLPGNVYTMPLADEANLYAVWMYDNGTQPSFTLTYNVAGGNSTPPAPHTPVYGGDKLTLRPERPDQNPTHAPVGGKQVVFTGWTRQRPTTPVRIYAAGERAALPADMMKPGDEFTMPYASTVLYAVWSYDTNNNDIPDPEEDTWTLTYDANGGAPTPNSLPNVLPDTVVRVTDTVPVYPTQGIYRGKPCDIILLGWSERKITEIKPETEPVDGLIKGGSSYPITGTPSYDGEPKTLYAVWALDINGSGNDEKYTLRFNANGGTGAPNAVPGILGGEEIDLPTQEPTHEPARNGANKNTMTNVVFMGWAMQQPSRAILTKTDTVPRQLYKAGDPFIMPNSNWTLYAVWAFDTDGDKIPDPEDDRWTLSYDANGGDANTAPPAVQGLLHKELATVAYSVPTHAQAMYNGKLTDVVLIGWTTEENKTAEILTKDSAVPPYLVGGDDYEMPNTHATLYALWAYNSTGHGPDPLQDKYALEYDVNGGNAPAPSGVAGLLAGEEVRITYEMATYGKALTSDGEEADVLLIGWTETPDTHIYEANETLPTHYKAGETYTLPQRKPATGGETVTLYALWGFDTNDDGLGPVDALENKYAVKFNINGGDPSTLPRDMRGLLAGKTYDLPTQTPRRVAELHNGRRTNVVFLGWSNAPVADILSAADSMPAGYYSAGDPITMAVQKPATDGEEVPLYAIWGWEGDNPVQYYSLEYFANGGNESALPAKQDKVGAGSIVTMPAGPVPHPGTTVDGKDVPVAFIGWTTTENPAILKRNDPKPMAGRDYYPEGSEFTMPAANTKLYAMWGVDENDNGTADVLEEKYTLEYNINGGAGTAPAKHENLLAKETVTLRADIPTHGGAANGRAVKFLGWTDEKPTQAGKVYSKTDTLPTMYQASGAYTMPAYPKKTVTLYAVWGYADEFVGITVRFD
ncbi:MAG: InlB B-repeat-containing protein, partial [Clostridia bacterium]|nr:InlB B-repeat-containing protein [Clostridia bacterium]